MTTNASPEQLARALQGPAGPQARGTAIPLAVPFTLHLDAGAVRATLTGALAVEHAGPEGARHVLYHPRAQVGSRHLRLSDAAIAAILAPFGLTTGGRTHGSGTPRTVKASLLARLTKGRVGVPRLIHFDGTVFRLVALHDLRGDAGVRCRSTHIALLRRDRVRAPSRPRREHVETFIRPTLERAPSHA